MPEKSKTDPLGSSDLVGYVTKVQNNRGNPLDLVCLVRTWPGGSKNVSEKWTDQCEVCGLKKKGHCYSRALFLKGKRAD